MKRIVIIGGVAGGATCAARLRRLNKANDVTMIERSPDVSFAACGLPYYIGREIKERGKLSLQNPKSLLKAFGIKTRVETTATAIDVAKKHVIVKGKSGPEEAIPYDKCLLSPGAKPIRPPVEGINDPRIFTLRNLQDMDSLDAALQKPECRRVVVIGAGFIGLEVVEQLAHIGKQVSLVERTPAVLPQADEEMAEFLHVPLLKSGVKLFLGDGLKCFRPTAECITAVLDSGKTIDADLVVLSIGVRAESELAKAAGVKLTGRGLIPVDEFMQTSVPDLYAVGDAVETSDLVFPDQRAWVALGNVANMQARIAADHMSLGKSIPYKGSLGTSIVRAFDTVLAVTGWTEKRLKAANIPYSKTIITGDSHASYYPGGKPVTMKLTYCPTTGRIFGAQAVGKDGVDKRVDVVATAIQGHLTIDDLSQTQLTYSPPFGAARDVCNTAGLCARNSRDGLVTPVWDLHAPGYTVLDVRLANLRQENPLEGTMNVPWNEIRQNLATLDKGARYMAVCAWGKTAYFASRTLKQEGYNVDTLIAGSIVHHKVMPKQK